MLSSCWIHFIIFFLIYSGDFCMTFSKAHPKGGFASPGAAPDEPQEHARAHKKTSEAPGSPWKRVPKSWSPLKKALVLAPAAAAPAAVPAAAAEADSTRKQSKKPEAKGQRQIAQASKAGSQTPKVPKGGSFCQQKQEPVKQRGSKLKAIRIEPEVMKSCLRT